jgi:hypothetical protein
VVHGELQRRRGDDAALGDDQRMPDGEAGVLGRFRHQVALRR